MKKTNRIRALVAGAVVASTLGAFSAQALYMPYSDVAEDHWAYQDISYTSQWGFFSGDENNHFNPDKTLTRAEFIMVLARIGNVQLSRYAGNDFTDVPEDAWYAQAANWGVRRGIISGTGDGKFDPNGIVTREQAATMSYLFLKSIGVFYGTANGHVPYTDVESISPWALEAVKAMYTSKLLTGRADNTFDPQANMSRAEAAALARRVYVAVDDGLDTTERVRYKCSNNHYFYATDMPGVCPVTGCGKSDIVEAPRN